VGVNLAELALNGMFYLMIARAPSGSSGRPMGLAAMFFIVGLIGWVVGAPRSIGDLAAGVSARSRRRVAGALLGLLLNLAALPLAMVLFGFIARVNGFILED
jgi:hypothetical protein